VKFPASLVERLMPHSIKLSGHSMQVFHDFP
jgi:hypothetical protein